MNDQTIAFIGAGNMARSLIGGLIADGFDAQHIWLSNPSAEKLALLEQQFSLHTTQDNREAVSEANIIVLAVKPDTLQSVARELGPLIKQQNAVVISVAAGISEQAIQQWLGGECAIVRCMPNTPALVGTGATGMHANSFVTPSQKDNAESILRAVGIIVWLETEAQLDIVTALSGCGPAYYFLIMEALENAACEMGLDAETAHLLSLQTALGAAQMALKATVSCEQLRQHVTSPGGVTERAIQLLEARDIRGLMQDTLQTARDRAVEIAVEHGMKDKS